MSAYKAVSWLAVGLATVAFSVLLLKHLGYPLLWQQEAVTAAFGQRVLEFGYPKIHTEINRLYPSPLPLEVGSVPELDAYRGGPWAPYFAAAFAETLAGDREDLWERTARLRLPFALLGSAGIAIWVATLLPLVGGDASRRRIAAAAVVVLCAGSISLLLHLREVGAAALVVFLVCGLLHVFVRRFAEASIGPGLYAAGCAGLLFLLFNTSPPAFASLLLLFGVVAAARSRSGTGALRRLAQDSAPLLVAVLAVAPLVSLYEVFGVYERLRPRQPTGYAAQLSSHLLHLLRYEWLVPALGARLAVTVVRRLASEIPPQVRLRLRAADGLCVLVPIHLLVVSALPFVDEADTLLLSPVLAGLLVLDGLSLLDLARSRLEVARRVAVAGLVLSTLLLVAGVVLRLPELRGRVHEITHQNRGPLDHVIPHIRERFERPSDLIVATNYEAPAFIYYLGSRVLVGAYGGQLASDLMFRPDIVIPRPHAGPIQMLGRLALDEKYDQTDLPVANLAANNAPSLSPAGPQQLVHRFESADLPEGEVGLPVLQLMP